MIYFLYVSIIVLLVLMIKAIYIIKSLQRSNSQLYQSVLAMQAIVDNLKLIIKFYSKRAK